MKHKYVVGLDGSGIDEAIRGVEEWKVRLEKGAEKLAQRLASLGATKASFDFSRAFYNGKNDVEVTSEQSGPATWVVRANGESVLFIEFGSGVKYGSGHPEPGEYGPGTFPGKGHWDDPRGWWYETDDVGNGRRNPKTGKIYAHSYGNPPAMAMYHAVREIEAEFQNMVREVFGP